MDHRGTVYALTDSSQSVLSNYFIDSFGRQIGESKGMSPSVPNELIYQTNWLTLVIGDARHCLSPYRLYLPDIGRHIQRDIYFSVDNFIFNYSDILLMPGLLYPLHRHILANNSNLYYIDNHNTYTLCESSPVIYIDTYGCFIQLADITVRGIINSGGVIGSNMITGLVTFGKTARDKPGAMIITLNVEFDCCCCHITDLEYSFGQTIYIPEVDDIFTIVEHKGKRSQTSHDIVVTSNILISIHEHEAVHAETNKTAARIIFEKAEDDCKKRVWTRCDWDYNKCKTHASLQAIEAIWYFKQQTEKAGHLWHEYTPEDVETRPNPQEYFVALEGMMKEWRRKEYCTG
jgi:hypothetical protein